jgi:hypothetical protein
VRSLQLRDAQENGEFAGTVTRSVANRPVHASDDGDTDGRRTKRFAGKHGRDARGHGQE